jgi:hypothetical protein
MKTKPESSEPSGTGAVRLLEDLDGNIDVEILIRELALAKREVELARRQFDTITDPRLVDHVVFRMGAAEQHFRYLLNLARERRVAVSGMSWIWSDPDVLIR